MSDQSPLPYVQGSPTSKDAADSMATSAAACFARVYQCLLDCGAVGATREELEAATGMPGNTVRPRVVELLADGLAFQTARTRAGRSGRQAAVLVATKCLPKPEEIPL